MIEGFEEFGGDGERLVRILVSQEVDKFLRRHNGSSRKRKHILRIGRILGRLREFGRDHLNNTEQFRMEGRYGKHKCAVFAVKAYQLRVYGGFLMLGGISTFVCIEGTEKKRDKPDKSQLKRVARKIGEIDAGNQ